jgi:hypothetical protein
MGVMAMPKAVKCTKAEGHSEPHWTCCDELLKDEPCRNMRKTFGFWKYIAIGNETRLSTLRWQLSQVTIFKPSTDSEAASLAKRITILKKLIEAVERMR